MKADVVKLVTFRVGEDLFAADVFSVERVLRYVTPATVPDVPAWVEGVMEHRGHIIPVIDMRRRLELPSVPPTVETRMLVLATKDGRIAAIVDAVTEVASLPAASMSPPPPLFRGMAAQFIRGIAKVGEQLVVVLEVERVLTSEDRIVLDRAMQGAETAARG
jgi:purine-binding chemotaxis protein CheW